MEYTENTNDDFEKLLKDIEKGSNEKNNNRKDSVEELFN
jgi:hypothetical protein